jgi:DNA-binding NtrC family response regulator
MILPEAARAEAPSSSRPPLVLCVDDESRTLSALQRALRREPYELVVTESPQEALVWVETRDVSLVVTDQRMPEMSGSTLISEIRERSPGTLFVMLTAYPSSIASDDPGWMNVAELMLKPWDDRQLRRVIRNLLEEVERGLGEDGFETPDVGGDGGSA